MKKPIVKPMIAKFSELRSRAVLAHLSAKSIAETKRRLLLRRFPRVRAKPGDFAW